MEGRELQCYCGAPMVLREGKYGSFYGCTKYPECDGAMGVHPDGEPMGVPADKETRAARMEAHKVFDKLWKPVGAPYSRSQAYFEMRCLMAMKEEEAHIANFSKEQCAAMIEKVNKRLERLQRRT